MNIDILLGTHESPAALMLTLETARISIDPITRGLWNQIRIHQLPRLINLEVGTAKELGLKNQRHRSAMTAFPTWRTTLCPTETIAHLALQQREWANGKRIVVIMEPLRFPEMTNDSYAYVLCLQNGKISAVNIHANDTIPEDTTLIAVTA